MIIPLLGHFKSEDGERYHLTPLAYRTDSWINIGTCVERLVQVKLQHQQTHGPTFSDRRGKILTSHLLKMEILDRLQEVQSSNPDLIPQEINVHEEFGISRSFRWGAMIQAQNKQLCESDIDAMNWWRFLEKANWHRPRQKVQDHYSDIRQMVPTLLSFSKALWGYTTGYFSYIIWQ